MMDDVNTVTIGCWHAPGIRLRVSEWFKTPGLDEPQLREIAIYDLAGSGEHHGEPTNPTLPGHTKIPAEHWKKWLELNEQSDLYTSGTIYEAEGDAGEEAPEAPQLEAERAQEKARAQAEVDARAAQEAQDESKREAQAEESRRDDAARQEEAARQDAADREAEEAARIAGSGQDGNDGDDPEPEPDAVFDAMNDDQLRGYLRDRGVAVDGRWSRKRLLVEAEAQKARG